MSKLRLNSGYTIFTAFVNYLFDRWIMYFPFHFIRLYFIKLRCENIGAQCSFLMGLELKNAKNISIGSNSILNKNVLLDARGGKIIIGSNVDIAQETNIWTLQHEVNDDSHSTKGNSIIIEDYVWIASRVTILPGVRIGKGAVIATNSVVTKDVEPMSIVAGIPARIISKRQNKLQYKLYYRPWFQ